MPEITLPDGSVKRYDAPVTPREIAESIGARLAKASIGARVDGALVDVIRPITDDARLALVTDTPRDDAARADALYLVRHSAAHVMAEAIQRIVPGALLVYGPPVDDGFYYDIAFPEDRPLSTRDFEAIETEMAAIIAEDRPFTRVELSVDEGMEKLRAEGSKYKLDNAERAIAAGASTLSWYVTGTPGGDWEDLCMGPHVPSTGRIGAFKIMTLAAAYWHGDAASDRLTRVYGTAFLSKKELDAHLERLDEAKRRDHRVIGKKLHLFTIDDQVGQGLVLWKPAGAVIRRELEEFIRTELVRQGYQNVYTPHIGKLDLFRTSGHFPYYRESQYPPVIAADHLARLASEGKSCAELANSLETGEIDGYLLKPMNCPIHIRLYASEPRSYRDLPVRLAEFGTVYRYEQSGELNGMTRVRGFTQDDAHLFCTEEQLPKELEGCLSLVNLIRNTLELTDYRVRVGLRDPDDTKFAGDPEVWARAEAACIAAAKANGMPFTEEPGEASFYGPKIDFVMRDALGRDWQLGTVQVDYVLPERFDLTYTGADNQPHRPVMIHRAPFGSFERFVGMLIEHYAGAFPTWLAPEQVRVLPVSDKFVEYGREVMSALKSIGMRVTIDTSDSRVSGKIKAGTEDRIPYLLVVGGKDQAAHTVSVRKRGTGDEGAMPLGSFIERIRAEVDQRAAH